MEIETVSDPANTMKHVFAHKIKITREQRKLLRCVFIFPSYFITVIIYLNIENHLSSPLKTAYHTEFVLYFEQSGEDTDFDC